MFGNDPVPQALLGHLGCGHRLLTLARVRQGGTQLVPDCVVVGTQPAGAGERLDRRVEIASGGHLKGV